MPCPRMIALFILIFCLFFGGSRLKAEKSNAVIDAIRLQIESKAPLEVVKRKICSKGKICRQHNGKACESKIVFALCWVICAPENDFSKSHCVKTTAQNTLLFNVGQQAFRDGQTPAQYLINTIEPSPQTTLDHELLCRGVCDIVASTNGPLFLHGMEADLRPVCARGCRKTVSPHPLDKR